MEEARNREHGVVLPVERYIELRRDGAALMVCWALLEFARDLDIPNEVMEHPVLQELSRAANDYAAWCNVRSAFIH